MWGRIFLMISKFPIITLKPHDKSIDYSLKLFVRNDWWFNNFPNGVSNATQTNGGLKELFISISQDDIRLPDFGEYTSILKIFEEELIIDRYTRKLRLDINCRIVLKSTAEEIENRHISGELISGSISFIEPVNCFINNKLNWLWNVEDNSKTPEDTVDKLEYSFDRFDIGASNIQISIQEKREKSKQNLKILYNYIKVIDNITDIKKTRDIIWELIKCEHNLDVITPENYLANYRHELEEYCKYIKSVDIKDSASKPKVIAVSSTTVSMNGNVVYENKIYLDPGIEVHIFTGESLEKYTKWTPKTLTVFVDKYVLSDIDIINNILENDIVPAREEPNNMSISVRWEQESSNRYPIVEYIDDCYLDNITNRNCIHGEYIWNHALINGYENKPEEQETGWIKYRINREITEVIKNNKNNVAAESSFVGDDLTFIFGNTINDRTSVDRWKVVAHNIVAKHMTQSIDLKPTITVEFSKVAKKIHVIALRLYNHHFLVSSPLGRFYSGELKQEYAMPIDAKLLENTQQASLVFSSLNNCDKMSVIPSYNGENKNDDLVKFIVDNKSNKFTSSKVKVYSNNNINAYIYNNISLIDFVSSSGLNNKLVPSLDTLVGHARFQQLKVNQTHTSEQSIYRFDTNIPLSSLEISNEKIQKLDGLYIEFAKTFSADKIFGKLLSVYSKELGAAFEFSRETIEVVKDNFTVLQPDEEYILVVGSIKYIKQDDPTHGYTERSVKSMNFLDRENYNNNYVLNRVILTQYSIQPKRYIKGLLPWSELHSKDLTINKLFHKNLMTEHSDFDVANDFIKNIPISTNALQENIYISNEVLTEKFINAVRDRFAEMGVANNINYAVVSNWIRNVVFKYRKRGINRIVEPKVKVVQGVNYPKVLLSWQLLSQDDSDDDSTDNDSVDDGADNDDDFLPKTQELSINADSKWLNYHLAVVELDVNTKKLILELHDEEFSSDDLVTSNSSTPIVIKKGEFLFDNLGIYRDLRANVPTLPATPNDPKNISIRVEEIYDNVNKYLSLTISQLDLSPYINGSSMVQNISELILTCDQVLIDDAGIVVTDQVNDNSIGHLTNNSAFGIYSNITSHRAGLAIYDNWPRIYGVPFFVNKLLSFNVVKKDNKYVPKNFVVDAVLAKPFEKAVLSDRGIPDFVEGTVNGKQTIRMKFEFPEDRSNKARISLCPDVDNIVNWDITSNALQGDTPNNKLPGVVSKLYLRPKISAVEGKILFSEDNKIKSKAYVLNSQWDIKEDSLNDLYALSLFNKEDVDINADDLTTLIGCRLYNIHEIEDEVVVSHVTKKDGNIYVTSIDAKIILIDIKNTKFYKAYRYIHNTFIVTNGAVAEEFTVGFLKDDKDYIYKYNLPVKMNLLHGEGNDEVFKTFPFNIFTYIRADSSSKVKYAEVGIKNVSSHTKLSFQSIQSNKYALTPLPDNLEINNKIKRMHIGAVILWCDRDDRLCCRVLEDLAEDDNTLELCKNLQDDQEGKLIKLQGILQGLRISTFSYNYTVKEIKKGNWEYELIFSGSYKDISGNLMVNINDQVISQSNTTITANMHNVIAKKMAKINNKDTVVIKQTHGDIQLDVDPSSIENSSFNIKARLIENIYHIKPIAKSSDSLSYPIFFNTTSVKQLDVCGIKSDRKLGDEMDMETFVQVVLLEGEKAAAIKYKYVEKVPFSVCMESKFIIQAKRQPHSVPLTINRLSAANSCRTDLSNNLPINITDDNQNFDLHLEYKRYGLSPILRNKFDNSVYLHESNYIIEEGKTGKDKIRGDSIVSESLIVSEENATNSSASSLHSLINSSSEINIKTHTKSHIIPGGQAKKTLRQKASFALSFHRIIDQQGNVKYYFRQNMGSNDYKKANMVSVASRDNLWEKSKNNAGKQISTFGNNLLHPKTLPYLHLDNKGSVILSDSKITDLERLFKYEYLGKSASDNSEVSILNQDYTIFKSKDTKWLAPLPMAQAGHMHEQKYSSYLPSRINTTLGYDKPGSMIQHRKRIFNTNKDINSSLYNYTLNSETSFAQRSPQKIENSPEELQSIKFMSAVEDKILSNAASNNTVSILKAHWTKELGVLNVSIFNLPGKNKLEVEKYGENGIYTFKSNKPFGVAQVTPFSEFVNINSLPYIQATFLPSKEGEDELLDYVVWPNSYLVSDLPSIDSLSKIQCEINGARKEFTGYVGVIKQLISLQESSVSGKYYISSDTNIKIYDKISILNLIYENDVVRNGDDSGVVYTVEGDSNGIFIVAPSAKVIPGTLYQTYVVILINDCLEMIKNQAEDSKLLFAKLKVPNELLSRFNNIFQIMWVQSTVSVAETNQAAFIMQYKKDKKIQKTISPNKSDKYAYILQSGTFSRTIMLATSKSSGYGQASILKEEINDTNSYKIVYRVEYYDQCLFTYNKLAFIDEIKYFRIVEYNHKGSVLTATSKSYVKVI